MRAALGRMDIIGKSKDDLIIAIVILHGYFDIGGILLLLEINDFFINGCLAFVQVLDELDDTALVVERLGDARPGIRQRDLDALVEERKLPQPVSQYIVMEIRRLEDGSVRLERHRRAGAYGRADLMDIALRLSLPVLLHV